MSKGFLLNIHLNYLDKKAYSGWDGKLPDPNLDSKSFQDRLWKEFEIWEQKNEDATISGVINSFRELANKATENDLIIITYSGHGAIDESSTYSEDKFTSDQAWCLYDGLFKDNHIHLLLSLFKKGTRVVLFSFCCHSGSMYKTSVRQNETPPTWKAKFMPDSVSKKLPETSWINIALNKIGCKQDLQCSLKYIGACQNNQYSYSTGTGDAAQLAWWEAFDKNPKSPYINIFNNIFKFGLIRANQTPVYKNLSKDKIFNNEYAFKI